jgi:hypothetical protein
VTEALLKEYRDVTRRLAADGKIQKEQWQSLVSGIGAFVSAAQVVVARHAGGSPRRRVLPEAAVYSYLVMPYFLASLDLSSLGRDFMYPFQPGHQLACHRHKRPRNELGLLSYLARNAHPSHDDLAILDPLFVFSFRMEILSAP